MQGDDAVILLGLLAEAVHSPRLLTAGWVPQ